MKINLLSLAILLATPLAILAHHIFPGIQSLDNFYCRQKNQRMYLPHHQRSQIQAALIDVAKARNMTGSSKTMDVGQLSLASYLSGDAHTEFGTIRNFLDAVGVKMLIVP